MSSDRNQTRPPSSASPRIEDFGGKSRKNVRVDITSWAELVEVGKNTNPVSITVEDISRGGLGGYSLTTLPVGTHVEICLKFVSREQRFVTETLRGRVVSSTRYGSSYTVGVAFVASVTDESCPQLSEYLRAVGAI